MHGRFTRNQILPWFRRIYKLKVCRWPYQPIIDYTSIWNPILDNFKDEIKNNQILKLLFETDRTKNETQANFRLIPLLFDIDENLIFRQQNFVTYLKLKKVNFVFFCRIWRKFTTGNSKSNQSYYLGSGVFSSWSHLYGAFEGIRWSAENIMLKTYISIFSTNQNYLSLKISLD